MKTSKLLSVVLSVLIALVVLTGSVAVPLLCRSFYYAHIGPMGLEGYGLSRAEIETAYNEMMDFCLGRREEFSAGVLAFSQSGADHFADVRGLFLLDLWAFAAALAVLACLGLLARRVGPAALLGRGPGFWAGTGLGTVFLLVGALAALDFDRAFTVFHALFFPGKDNWLFDPAADQIINILPQEYFRNCALLILALLAVGCGLLIGVDLLRGGAKEKILHKSEKT